MKVLYYDCFSGISGDMNLGAMLDLGVEKKYLCDQLKLLALDQKFEIRIWNENKKGIASTRIEFECVAAQDYDSWSQARTLSEIREIILTSSLADGIKNRSIRMFELLAEAEGKVHGIDSEKVHFHEAGAMDAILDIVGAAICFEYLQPDRIICSRVELGGGFVHCCHGLLPVPAPAVVELLKGVPVSTGRVNFETTTPTGAVILMASVDEFADRMEVSVEKIGYGAGKRDMEIPNVLRVCLGTLKEDTADKPIQTRQYMVETNIDDMNPEIFEYVEERLFATGALDVFKTPIIMKKGRPAVKLSVLTEEENIPVIEEIIFRETSAIGIRKYAVEKTMLPREVVVLNTKYGPISVKFSYYRGKIIRGKPEYRECEKTAKEQNLPLPEIFREISRVIMDYITDQQ